MCPGHHPRRGNSSGPGGICCENWRAGPPLRARADLTLHLPLLETSRAPPSPRVQLSPEEGGGGWGRGQGRAPGGGSGRPLLGSACLRASFTHPSLSTCRHFAISLTITAQGRSDELAVPQAERETEARGSETCLGLTGLTWTDLTQDKTPLPVCLSAQGSRPGYPKGPSQVLRKTPSVCGWSRVGQPTGRGAALSLQCLPSTIWEVVQAEGQAGCMELEGWAQLHTGRARRQRRGLWKARL